jgi:hypothetical protein
VLHPTQILKAGDVGYKVAGSIKLVGLVPVVPDRVLLGEQQILVALHLLKPGRQRRILDAR